MLVRVGGQSHPNPNMLAHKAVQKTLAQRILSDRDGNFSVESNCEFTCHFVRVQHRIGGVGYQFIWIYNCVLFVSPLSHP